ncbi:hypothetical protein AWENTII_000749 [Aspergillus wentii]
MALSESPFFVFSAIVAAIVGVLWLIRAALQAGHRPASLPPGPPTVPIFGNELQIPKAHAHFQFMKWAHEYGGIFSLKRFKNTTIVISDRKLIKELVDKKSNVYSHRPASLVSHLITHSDHLLVMQYGDTWRMLRKIVHQFFMEPNCEKEHWKVQEAEASQMLYDFLTSPGDHMLHPKRYSNSITNSLVFGIRSKTVRDEYMEKLFALMEKWSLVQELGATPPVDDFKLLRMLPQWMLGNWRNRALEVENLMQSLYSTVLNQVRDRRTKGVYRDSFMDRVLDKLEKTPLSESQLRFLGGALTKFPAVQARAHAEIDRVVGSERSPGWADFAELPYINCMIKEAHRWRPVSPLGVPHAVAQDDYLNGMLLPKGSTIVLNVWAIHHDPSIYPNPERYEPSRFEEYPSLAPTYAASGAEHRDHYGYGAGRRICPGIHLAERNLFIAIAKLLWAFEFTQPTGSSSDIDPESGASQGFLHCPKDYGCGVRLRSPEKGETIVREFREAREVFERFD